jgi:hypothetical protein
MLPKPKLYRLKISLFQPVAIGKVKPQFPKTLDSNPMSVSLSIRGTLVLVDLGAVGDFPTNKTVQV